MVCRRETSAAVVEPLGRKAYWSAKLSVGGGQSIAGYRKSRTMIFSAIRDSTAVTEMGRKSLGCVGPVFLGTGQILDSSGNAGPESSGVVLTDVDTAQMTKEGQAPLTDII